MRTGKLNEKAFGFTRASYNSQPDLHISTKVARINAKGNVLTGWKEGAQCNYFACEAYDLKVPGQRVAANQARPTEGAEEGARTRVLPHREPFP
jgi:hypothetical protein